MENKYIVESKKYSINDTEYNDYIRQIKDIKPLTFEEEQKLAKRMKRGDKRAREELIKANLKLVIKIALHFYRSGFNLMDLIQEGNIGLIIAIDKFDYKQKLKLSTYSSWWIKHYILKAIISKINIIDIPIKKTQLMRHIERTYDYWIKNYNRIPTVSEISQHLKIDESKVKNMIKLSNITFTSLENYFPEHLDFELLDHLSDSEKYEPENIIVQNLLEEDTEKMLKSLMDREALILKYRYGLINGRPYTLREIGKMLGVTSESIRQIENKILAKLKKRYSHLKDYLLN